MKKNRCLESILEDILKTAPGSEVAAVLAQRVRRERAYRDNRIRDALHAHDDPVFKRTAEEADLLCTVENALLAEIGSISSTFMTPASEFLHTLLALESVQRIRLGIPICQDLPLTIEMDNWDAAQYQSSFDALAGWDYFLEYFGEVLKQLMRQATDVAILPIATFEDFGNATAHFEQSSKWQMFHEFRSFWEAGALKIDTKNLVLDARWSELVRAFRVSLSRLRAFRVARSADRLQDDQVRSGTRELPFDVFRSQHEIRSCYLTSLQFFSAELREVVHGASLAEWIRAYHVLREFAWKCLREIPPDEPCNLLVERAPSFFQMLLVDNGGISQRHAEAIIKHLTFGSTSNDLLDCPLIPSGPRLLMLPAVTAILEPAHSLESMLHSIRSGKSHELQFIGPGLESSVRASLRDAGVPAHNISHGKYECDVAFVLDDILFLCECKCKFVAADFSTYAKWEHQLCTDVVEQHKRTCDFFAGHLNLIRQKLRLSPQWQPKAIERVIITSAKLGRSIQVNGYWIVDHHTLHAYFTRQPPTVVIGSNEKFQLADERLEGPPTAAGLLSYLSSPQVIAIHESFLADRTIPLKAGELKLTLNDCETYGEVQYED